MGNIVTFHPMSTDVTKYMPTDERCIQIRDIEYLEIFHGEFLIATDSGKFQVSKDDYYAVKARYDLY